MCYVYKIDMYILVKLYFANFHTLDRLSCTLWFPSYFMANVLEAVEAAEKILVCLSASMQSFKTIQTITDTSDTVPKLILLNAFDKNYMYNVNY